MSLCEMLSDYWYAFQQELFPRLESELGPMGERYELFVTPLGSRRTLADKPRDGHAGGLGALADALPFGVRGHHRARVPSRVWFILHSLPYCYVGPTVVGTL